jgi:enoyl-CoA hydratase/carnithine racemase
MESLNITIEKGYAVVQIDHGKVNAIDVTLAGDLLQAFQELTENDQVKGVILAGRPHCFSAGLNIMSLASGGLDGVRAFWGKYLRALQTMVRFPKPLVCAITGYAPAGGTILTLTADYRIMGKGEKHVMGMHEFKMSMQIPELMCDIYAYHLGEKTAWEMVQTAALFNSDEALALGLVNESVEVDEVMERAEKQIKKLTRVYGPVYQKSKNYFRKGLLKLVDRDIDEMVEVIVKDMSDPFVMKSIEMFLTGLKK